MKPGGGLEDRHPIGKSLARLPLQLPGFGHECRLRIAALACEARQDRIVLLRPERAASGNFDRAFQRLRQVGKQHRHFRPALEIMVRRQFAPVINVDDGSFGNGDQRVMRLEVGALGKIRLVRGDQRQPDFKGSVD